MYLQGSFASSLALSNELSYDLNSMSMSQENALAEPPAQYDNALSFENTSPFGLSSSVGVSDFASTFLNRPAVPQSGLMGMMLQMFQGLIVSMISALQGGGSAVSEPDTRVAQPAVDFSNDNSIKEAMQREMPPNNGSPLNTSITQMMRELETLEPESPQALVLQSHISNLGRSAGMTEKSLERFFILSAVRSLDNVSGSLVATQANFAPESPQTLAYQARLSSIEATRNRLIGEYSARLEGPVTAPEPSQAQPAIDFNNDASVQQGIDAELPSNYYGGQIRNLLALSLNLEIESPQKLALDARITSLAGLAGMTDASLQKVFNLTETQALKRLTNSLLPLMSNLEPESSNAAMLQNRIDALNMRRDTIIGMIK